MNFWPWDTSGQIVNRACFAATGKTAKALVDQRVALEGARLLAHAKISVNEISHRLGFTETTNFVRFFVRMVGSTPTLSTAKPTGADIQMPIRPCRAVSCATTCLPVRNWWLV
jgi:AraC-like DNA-binding protein